MYIINKAKDEDKFTIHYSEGKFGHRYDQAMKLAREVNEALECYAEIKRLFGKNWRNEIEKWAEVSEAL